jgi:sulfur oxygenase/reductase
MEQEIKKLFDAEPQSTLYVAINRVLVKNELNLMRMMKQASSKMCLATALTPGFRGFDLMRQTGVCPMGLRWGASSDMGPDISHIWIDQFTYWTDWTDHETFHETFQDVVVDTCSKCGEWLLDGPEEPIYRIIKSDLPKLLSHNQMIKLQYANQGDTSGYAVDSGQTVTVSARHSVRPGKESEFEEGEIQTMEMLKNTTGVLGYQIIKRIGISTLGSAHAKMESILEFLKTGQATDMKRVAEVWEGYSIPAEYITMVEFESLQAAQTGMPHVNVRPEILNVHGPKVIENCVKIPSVYISQSMFKDDSYREVLQGKRK